MQGGLHNQQMRPGKEDFFGNLIIYKEHQQVHLVFTLSEESTLQQLCPTVYALLSKSKPCKSQAIHKQGILETSKPCPREAWAQFGIIWDLKLLYIERLTASSFLFILFSFSVSLGPMANHSTLDILNLGHTRNQHLSEYSEPL